jgi:hypothetical protein
MPKSIFDLDEFKPFFDIWHARLTEFQARESYYDGSVYKKYNDGLGWLGPRMYKNIRPLYLPLSRAVDVDAGIIPGGWELDSSTTPEMQAALDLIFGWSHWATDGVLYVHYGSVYGCSGLKVADLREARQVVIKPVNPKKFLLVPGAQYDETPAMALWIEDQTGDNGELYEYAEVITPQAIRTFRGGAPYGYDGRDAEYKNELGFVPYVEAHHIEVGDELGECTYQKAIPMLDAVNTLASQLSDIIKAHSEPQWVVEGAQPSDLVHGSDNVWFVPTGGKVYPVVAGIDIPGVLDFVRETRDQVYGALPELAFDELRKKDSIATATLELQLAELVIKVQRVRPNYDAGMVAALRMAGRAGQGMGLPVGALDDDALKINAERAVLGQAEADKLAVSRAFWDAAQSAVKAGCPLTVFLKIQGWADEDIAAVETNPEYQARKSLLSNAAMGASNG